MKINCGSYTEKLTGSNGPVQVQLTVVASTATMTGGACQLLCV
jgi:hypothetical protein